jgi:hypothetical protein
MDGMALYMAMTGSRNLAEASELTGRGTRQHRHYVKPTSMLGSMIPHDGIQMWVSTFAREHEQSRQILL